MYCSRTVLALSVAALLLLPAAARAAEGDLDPSFGTGGKVSTPIPPGAEANAVTVDHQGRVIAAGWSGSYPNFSIAVARYMPSGQLDPTFNGTGTVVTPVGGTFSQAWAVATDSQDRVLVGGTDGNDFVVARYTQQGTLDPSFGTGGVTTTNIGSSAYILSMAVDPQGRIVVGGYANTGAVSALARYTDNGQLDPNFGTGGKVLTPMGPSGMSQFSSIAIDPQGRIVAAGYAYSGSDIGLALARYTDSGALDSTFGTGGKVLPTPVTVDDTGTSVAIDPQGRIVVAGHSGPFPQEDWAIWRFTDGGSPDSSFNGSGRATVSLSSGTDVANAVAIDAEGRILEAGSAYNGSNDDFALVRWTPAGTLDPSFGTAGKVMTGFGASSIDDAFAMVLDARQRPVLAGYAGGDFGLARYVDDLVPPMVTITSGPAENALTNQRRPTFGFTVNDPTASAGCAFDLLAAVGCASPFTPGSPLADGRHTLTIGATDLAGNVGGAQRTFTVDATPPRLRITGHSKIKTRHRRARARFRFKTNEHASFRCKLDRRKTKRCRSRYRTPKLKRGRHKLTVVATDRAGNHTRKVKKFRIVHR